MRFRSLLAALREKLPVGPLTIVLACVIGVLGGYGAVIFTFLIEFVTTNSVIRLSSLEEGNPLRWGLYLTPAAGILLVAWLTRRFAPEAEGHGVPEVIVAVARKDGVIRPRVALVKILASGLCIGTGGSVGREGPIVQIGSSLGSMAGQFFHLSPRHVKVLVAAGAAAGISATFNAPIAGVIFASEVILGSFAVESLTPLVVASVLADVVQKHVGEHGHNPAFTNLNYEYLGSVSQIPSYVVLGLLCGLAAVTFTKMLYAIEDLGRKWFPKWWVRALALGTTVGVIGVAYPLQPPVQSSAATQAEAEGEPAMPALFGVGYRVVDHALHLQMVGKPSPQLGAAAGVETGALQTGGGSATAEDTVKLRAEDLLAEFWWLLPLAFLKPLVTSLTLGGGGSGGIFAPSLFLGATVGASFGLLANMLVPGASASPGVYAVVGMGAVVAGTTHGVMSAILIVYEMTGDYYIILPIMAASGLACTVASFIDRDSIYYKKLNRRGESIARGHDVQHLEHIMVRDVMIRHFPTVRYTDNAAAIVRVARANAHIETLPVMGEDDRLVGIIRAEDLHRVLDTDVPSHVINAEDIAIPPPTAVAPDANLLEALREFGTRDIETLPVEEVVAGTKRLVGLLLRDDLMRRYRVELLAGGK